MAGALSQLHNLLIHLYNSHFFLDILEKQSRLALQNVGISIAILSIRYVNDVVHSLNCLTGSFTDKINFA